VQINIRCSVWRSDVRGIQCGHPAGRTLRSTCECGPRAGYDGYERSVVARFILLSTRWACCSRCTLRRPKSRGPRNARVRLYCALYLQIDRQAREPVRERNPRTASLIDASNSLVQRRTCFDKTQSSYRGRQKPAVAYPAIPRFYVLEFSVRKSRERG
jgi:hypothetical protein